MIDGGRVKLRQTTRRQKGEKKTKTQKRRFKTVLREVKLVVVFEMDEQGRLKKGTQAASAYPGRSALITGNARFDLSTAGK